VVDRFLDEHPKTLKGLNTTILITIEPDLKQYLSERWNDNHPNLKLLIENNYISSDRKITEKSFALLDEAMEASVFISYKRSESSAFALLVNNTLKQYDIEPFIDMQLQAGDDWHAELEQNIKNSDYFIVLLSNKTLHSKVTVKEIQWAIEGDVTIIPMWHNDFEFNAQDWTNLTVSVSQALASTHTIRVLEENPLTYDTALRELLNRFGIST
ncbi:MAG: toll/interleukin-1 receptor domain-containing protein, partial [Chloroflexota bacterium]